ncbi:hypothetical protein [Pseudomonas sp. IT-P176]|uniref:hypothetical protein n=1 Tax=Pseudomonas sp. IT-P176 TaxID=3026444 RepID=UPI0039DFC952
MSNNSVKDMVEWLRAEPQTRGWSAILAYDREKTNTVLLQEYISRFSTNNYMMPITELLEDNQTSTHREYLANYVMDSPRLSFINSNLENSWVRLRMKVLGGTHLTFEKPTGAPAWTVTKVALWGPMDGPTLHTDIDLKATPGTVDKQGGVSLNLADGQNYRMTYAETEHLGKLTGERFKARFNQLPASQKTYVLNELVIDKDHLLKPVRFLVRTHNKRGAGATLGPNEDNEEGAVVLFVAMEGELNGELPARNSDLRYLLPDGHSATLLLGHRFFHKSVIVAGLGKISNSALLEYFVEMDGPGSTVVRGIHVASGRRVVSKEYSKTIEGVSYVCPEISADIPGRGSSSLTSRTYVQPVGGDRFIYFIWSSENQSQPLIISGKAYSVPTTWQASGMYTVGVNPKSFEIEFSMNPQGVGESTVELRQIPMPAHHRNLMELEYRRWVDDFLKDMVKDFALPVSDINVLMLNSLLFRGKNSVQPTSAHFVYDFAIFGHVGPTLTGFTLNNLEPVLGRSDTFYFETLPKLTTNVVWKVESVPGSNGKLGSINETSGVYTAPRAGDFEGDYIRVRVIATAGGQTSSALVTVLRYDLAINPLVQVVGAGDPGGREVSGGSRGYEVLQWNIADPSSGAVVVPSTKEGGDHTYYPGPRVVDQVFSLDHIIVTNPRDQKTETSTVLVLHEQASLNVLIDTSAGLPPNQVQLKAYFGNTPVDPDEGIRWSLLDGSGRVDPATGVYTIDPMGLHKFAIVIAHIPPLRPGRPSDDGFILLPIPLVSVSEAMQMLSADDEPVFAH